MTDWKTPRLHRVTAITAALTLGVVGSLAAAPVIAQDDQVSGSVTLGSRLGDEVPKAAIQEMTDAFTAETGIPVTINVQDNEAFQEAIVPYLTGLPDDVVTWSAGFRAKFFADQGLLEPINDVWTNIESNYNEGFKVASTGDDGNQYVVPFTTYPWAVFYRKSLFEENGYTPPTTIEEFKALGDQMIEDGLVPLAFGDVDGWPAMGTFDIMNLRLNGYDFHVALLAGEERWDDPRVVAVFEAWRDLLPYFQAGAAGRTWQEAAQALLNKEAGMYYLGTFVSEAFGAAGQDAIEDLDFFPFPLLGTEFDSENAIEAPIDGFMVAKNSPTLQDNYDAVMAYVEYLASGPAQTIYVTANPGLVATASDADTSGYNEVQRKSKELIESSNRITQFMDRDTRNDFTGANGMQAFLLSFIQDPDQDLNALVGQIQSFWDSLPPLQ